MAPVEVSSAVAPVQPRAAHDDGRGPSQESEPNDQHDDQGSLASAASVSTATACSGRRRKSPRRRLSATVACTSTAAKSVSSGVATTSLVPSAVVADNTRLLLAKACGPTRPLSRRPRDVGERPLDAAIPDQQMALAVERHGPVVERQPERVRVRNLQFRVTRAGHRPYGRKRQRRVDASVELEQQRHAPQMPSESGAAFRKPDAPAAFASTGRLQMAPVAWRRVGFTFLIGSRLVIASPNGCCRHEAAGRRCGRT